MKNKVCKLNAINLFIKSILIFTLIFSLLYLKINNNVDYLSFNFINTIEKLNQIKVAFYNNCLRYGGIERVTSILLNHFSKEKSFKFTLITRSLILEDEYKIPNDIQRISLAEQKISIFEAIKKENLDILIYNCDDKNEIERLNKINTIKVIYATHSSFFYRIYLGSYRIENTVYQAYKKCKYVLSLIPLENYYLFKKWGINSVLLENPSTYEYDSVIPSDLSNQNIIMIGRGDFPAKRFDLGILAMKSIIKEIPECQMQIVSSTSNHLEKSINELNLKNNIKITGFLENPELYLKNASLHILTSLNEAYPMSLGEVKIFGVPSILCGLDYLILSKGGNIIIYDDNPDTIAKKAIEILKDDKLRKTLGKEARLSMQKLSNNIIFKKWIKLLHAVNNGIDKYSYSKLFDDEENRITEKEADIILNNQLNLLKKRINHLKGITLVKLESFNLE